MSENKIKVGSLVALKSGSDKMVVESLQDDVCKCCWIDRRSGDKRGEDFHVNVLTLDLQYAWCVDLGAGRAQVPLDQGDHPFPLEPLHRYVGHGEIQSTRKNPQKKA